MNKAAPRLTFVVADDDRMTRNVLRLLLNELQHRIVGEAADGEKAIELCRAHQPDIAFLDIDMPRADGHQVARAIRENCAGTQIVMVSSLPTLPNVQEALEAGACAFVVKPFNSAKVGDVIRLCQRKIAAAGKMDGH